jgi:hypothetical protein
MPITKDSMDKIENGIYDNREALKSLDTSISGINTNISDL